MATSDIERDTAYSRLITVYREMAGTARTVHHSDGVSLARWTQLTAERELLEWFLVGSHVNLVVSVPRKAHVRPLAV